MHIVSKTIELICFFSLLLFSCKETNSGFIRELNLPHHSLTIRLSDLQPRIRIFVQHNSIQKELSFVLDTGSNISLIRKNIFPSEGLEGNFQLKSLSGEMNRSFTEMNVALFSQDKELIYGKTKFFSIEFDSKFSFDGIIGNNILENFDLFLEIPEKVYLIHPSNKKNNLKEFRKIPFLFVDGHILLYSTVNNIQCKFILDTGAGISYLNLSKASNVNLRQGGKASFIDLGGKVQEGVYHIAENLCVDENLCQKKIELLSGNSIEDFLSGEEQIDGILGLNWIEKYSILIDYKNSSLYIKQR